MEATTNIINASDKSTRRAANTLLLSIMKKYQRDLKVVHKEAFQSFLI